MLLNELITLIAVLLKRWTVWAINLVPKVCTVSLDLEGREGVFKRVLIGAGFSIKIK